MNEGVSQVAGHLSHLLEKFGHESGHIGHLVRSIGVLLDYFRLGVG